VSRFATTIGVGFTDYVIREQALDAGCGEITR
jgi:hypothetical protein